MKKNLVSGIVLILGYQFCLATTDSTTVVEQKMTFENLKLIHVGSLLEKKSDQEILQAVNYPQLGKPEKSDSETAKKPDLETPILVAEGPKVGGGGFTYYYSSVPQLISSIKRFVFRLNVYKHTKLKEFFPNTPNVDEAVNKILNNLWLDMHPENQSRDWDKIDQGYVLTARFLDQINNRNLSSPQMFYIFKTLIEILLHQENETVDTEKTKALANLLIYNVGSCGFSGDLDTRKKECQLFYQLPKDFSVVQRRAIEKPNEHQEIDYQVFEHQGKLWAFIPTTFLAYQGQQAEKACSDLSLLKKFNVKWELPTNSEAEEYFKHYSEVRKKIYLNHQPIFSKTGGTVCWEAPDSCINLMGNAVLGTGAAIYLSWGFPPAMILMALINPTGVGARGILNQKVHVACVADSKTAKSDSSDLEDEFAINAEQVPVHKIDRVTDENMNIEKIEAFWNNSILKFIHLMRSWQEQDLERLREKTGNLFGKSHLEVMQSMEQAIFKTPFLFQHKYRKNPKDLYEPLLLDYVKSEDVPEELKKQYPQGYVYPVRAFLNKFNKSNFTSADEWEFVQVLFHEIAHLYKVGRDNDKEAKEFSDHVVWSIARYWDNCGSTDYLKTKSQCVQSDKNRDPKFIKNWEMVYQWIDRLGWYGWDFKQVHLNRKSKLLWGFAGLRSLSSLGAFEKSGFCSKFYDSENSKLKWRIPTREEVQRDIWDHYEGLTDIFDRAQGENDKSSYSPPNCLFDPDRNIMCKDPEQNKTTFFIRDKFGGTQNYALICVAETD